ncbi:ThiF family adenylyltransferase [Mucilaginibacter sp.]|uniref:HesA/MoeB/ThiF family protein n=1 Tax=Mucilaginibacter sp. TaxID=1882438 RepID=UPI00284A59F5|nr:ThiF family adenylyltransferase [Mucilaginibacter sp.]MDR3695776.1 ThiF family adenylyltransferase [Mucilaginibacter sp.]
MVNFIFVLENDIRQLYNDKLYKPIKGYAYGMDNNTVIHAFVKKPITPPSGNIINVTFHLCDINEFRNNESLYDGEIKLVFAIDEDGYLKHTAYSRQAGEANSFEIKFIPEQSELYSRSKGLLETSVLKNKTVGIVGIGSGGSPIAIELAKAGVGRFVLIDFDRLELSNVARHVCGINDLGRYKTFAVRDYILQKNPYAEVSTYEIDVNEHREICSDALSKVDLIIAASDNDKSRFFLNDLALKYNTPAIFGRAITRAIGGDVLRVRPRLGPCYNCLYSQDLRNTEEEISQKERQAKKFLPDYTSEESLNAVVQVGLASDIAPITNFMVKLALVELSRGTNSGISSLEEDLVADFYIWANRREYVYEDWSKLEYNFNKPSILRWYGAKVMKDPDCMSCGI